MVIGIDCSRAFVDDRTGTENYAYQVVKHLLRLPEAKKHKLVLFIRPRASLPAWTRRREVTVKVINWRYLWTQGGLAAASWRQPLDVLWIPAHTLPVLRRPGVRTVVTIHGLEYRWLPEYRNFFQRWYLPLSTFYAVKRADRLIAVSQFTKRELRRELKADPAKITVVREGVSFPGKSKFRAGKAKKIWEQYGVKKGRYALFIGSLQPRKNLPALVKAFVEFSRRRPDFKLLISGGIGWEAEKIFQAPVREGVQEKVVFTGRIGELEKEVLLLGAGVYVQPSRTEGFGLPILEAMAVGVPVVSSDGGALPEVVGEAGLTVRLGRGFEKRLARAMGRVVCEPELRARVVAAGRRRARRWSWEKTAKESLEVLLEV